MRNHKKTLFRILCGFMLAFGCIAGAYAVAPATPALISVSQGYGSATLVFSASASATSYTASCSATGQTTQSKTGAVSPITVSGLTADLVYSCSISAANSSGSSAASAAQTV